MQMEKHQRLDDGESAINSAGVSEDPPRDSLSIPVPVAAGSYVISGPHVKPENHALCPGLAALAVLVAISLTSYALAEDSWLVTDTTLVSTDIGTIDSLSVGFRNTVVNGTRTFETGECVSIYVERYCESTKSNVYDMQAMVISMLAAQVLTISLLILWLVNYHRAKRASDNEIANRGEAWRVELCLSVWSSACVGVLGFIVTIWVVDYLKYDLDADYRFARLFDPDVILADRPRYEPGLSSELVFVSWILTVCSGILPRFFLEGKCPRLYRGSTSDMHVALSGTF